MGRVAFAEGVYTDGDNCLIQRSGDQLTGYGLYNGSVLLDGKRSLFRARDLFSLGVQYESNKVIASFKANSEGEIAIYCPGRPMRVMVNGVAAKFNYIDGEKLLRVAIPAGEGALQVHC